MVGILKIIYGYNKDSIFVYSDNIYVLIGRNSLGSEAHFKLNTTDKYISRNHCLIEKVENKYYILDNNSLNGTFLVQRNQANCIQIKSKTELKNKDLIIIGNTIIAFILTPHKS